MTKSKQLTDKQLFAKHNTHNTLRSLTLDFEDYLTLLKERDSQRVCRNCKYLTGCDESDSDYCPKITAYIRIDDVQSCTEFEGKV